jgi:hypothetical protein
MKGHRSSRGGDARDDNALAGLNATGERAIGQCSCSTAGAELVRSEGMVQQTMRHHCSAAVPPCAVADCHVKADWAAVYTQGHGQSISVPHNK